MWAVKKANKHASKKTNGKGKNASKVSKRGFGDKTMVLGLVECGGKVRTFVVPDRTAGTLQGIMRANVETYSPIISYALRSYTNLRDQYQHEACKHVPGDYRTYGDVHTNNIEGYWSILKRGIIGTFHFVSPQHLQRYCDEFARRYNTRTATTPEKFLAAVKYAHSNRLKYRDLTPNKPFFLIFGML